MKTVRVFLSLFPLLWAFASAESSEYFEEENPLNATTRLEDYYDEINETSTLYIEETTTQSPIDGDTTASDIYTTAQYMEEAELEPAIDEFHESAEEDNLSTTPKATDDLTRGQCASTLFGCCPDGLTPAHGPENYGCCAASEYGCCPNNYSPASGPYDDGCESIPPKYGLCPDGLSPALDSNFLGCGCRHMKDGCCPDGSTSAKGPNYEGCDCSTFEFGCCPDGVSVAQGSHFEGCKSCNSDLGCCPDGITPKGSQESCDECQNTKYGCCFDGVSPAQGLNFEGCEGNPLKELSGTCSGNSSTGPCNDFTIKWFYDSHWGGCNKFWYGGCEPGKNHFDTEEECKGICVHPRGSRVCHLSLNAGSCDAIYNEFYFDKAKGTCQPFVYGGCLGNGNRFTTKQACKDMCEPEDMSMPICSKPLAEGMCSGDFSRWFFDSQEGKCKHFSYSGCGGNDNRFLTENECLNTCRKEIKALQRKVVCHSNVHRFPGNISFSGNGSLLPGWGYDSLLRRCIPIYIEEEEPSELFFSSWEDCSHMCPSTYPPVITLPKGNEILVERDSPGAILIPISVRANPPARVFWFKNNRAMDVLHEFRYELGPESSLKVTGKVTDFDGGKYTIKAENGVGAASLAEVEVIVYPLYSKVSIDLEKAIFPPGSEIVIPCTVEGYPPPDITWYKMTKAQKVEVNEDRERIFIDTFQVSTFLSKSNLTILRSNEANGGSYVCEAHSPHSPSASDGVRISVSYGPGEKCVDRPSYKHCHRIIHYKLCGNKYYAQYCCRSCMEAGFLPAGQA